MRTGGLPGQLDAGSFAVSGAARLDARGRPAPGAWALAGSHPAESPVVPAGSKLAVVAFAPAATGRGALLVLTLPRVEGTATVPIQDNCAAVQCAQGLLLLGVDPRQPHEEVQGSCVLAGGTVQVVAVEGGRIRGTFSAQGRCARDFRQGPRSEMVVQQGQFDVEVSEAYRSGLQLWS